MTVTETTATAEGVLAFIDESVRALQQDGLEPRTILVGPDAYDLLRHAIARQFNRSPGLFETYQYLDVVLDPFRGDAVCVVPAPRELADGVRPVRI
ncbi:MAG: family 4C encapsulin nanocompartment shell protein [Rhodothermales bacterium]